MCSIRGIDKTNINELCFKLLLASLYNKSTEIDMNVNNTVKHIHQTIIQVFLLPYKLDLLRLCFEFYQFWRKILYFQDYGTLVASTNTFFSLYTVPPAQERLNRG